MNKTRYPYIFTIQDRDGRCYTLAGRYYRDDAHAAAETPEKLYTRRIIGFRRMNAEECDAARLPREVTTP